MSRIKVKNFGPIKQGLLGIDEFLEIKKVTIFIGNQGSGKSTITKLISTLTWIEKALLRGDFKEEDLDYKAFKNHCEYQNIHNYFVIRSIFSEASHIEYQGDNYYISCIDSQITVKKNNIKDYIFSKVMYIPAERNFVSSVKNVRLLRGLPMTLYTFSDEFFSALENLKEPLDLPINNTKIEYQGGSKIPWITGEDYQIRLSESSSGYQSFVPLFIVTQYLINEIIAKDSLSKQYRKLSIDDSRKLRNELEQILKDENISDEIKKLSLEIISDKYFNSCLINIVEEPEQNLFPTSQCKVLYNLLSLNNTLADNKLIITTHSPYIINFISIAIYAHSLIHKINLSLNKDELIYKLNLIVPESSQINNKDVAIYQMNESNGEISLLSSNEGIPTDKNYLNMILKEGNEMFDRLLEIEEGL